MLDAIYVIKPALSPVSFLLLTKHKNHNAYKIAARLAFGSGRFAVPLMAQSDGSQAPASGDVHYPAAGRAMSAALAPEPCAAVCESPGGAALFSVGENDEHALATTATSSTSWASTDPLSSRCWLHSAQLTKSST